MVKVQDIAKWFLSQDSMTHKKIQKTLLLRTSVVLRFI